MKDRIAGILSCNLLRRASALLMCVCILLSGMPSTSEILVGGIPQVRAATGSAEGSSQSSVTYYGDVHILETEDDGEGEDEPAPVAFVWTGGDGQPTNQGTLEEWCSSGPNVTLYYADTGEPVQPGDTIPSGTRVKFYMMFFLKQAILNPSVGKDGGFEPGDYVIYTMPNKIPLTAFSKTDDNGYLNISATEGSSDIKVTFLDGFFSADNASAPTDYFAEATIIGTLFSQGTSGEVTYKFSGTSEITIRFEAGVTLTKALVKNVYKDASGNYWAEYKFTLETTQDITDVKIIDYAGQSYTNYIKIDTGSFAIDPAANNTIRAERRTGSTDKHCTDIYINEGTTLPAGTYTITYKAMIDKTAAENGSLKTNTASAHRRNWGRVYYKDAHGVDKHTDSGPVTISYDGTIAGGLSKSGSLKYEIHDGGIRASVYYTIQFYVYHPVSELTIIDERGGAFNTGFGENAVTDVSWNYNWSGNKGLSLGDNTNLGDKVDKINLSKVSGNSFKFVLTNPAVGKHLLFYRFYIDDPTQTYTRDQRTNRVTMKWSGLEQFTEHTVNLTDRELEYSKSFIQATTVEENGKEYYDLEYKITVKGDIDGYGLHNIVINDTFTNDSNDPTELIYPIHLDMETWKHFYLDLTSPPEPGAVVTERADGFTLNFANLTLSQLEKLSFKGNLKELNITYKLRVPAAVVDANNNTFHNEANGKGSDYKPSRNPTITKNFLSGDIYVEPMQARWSTVIDLPYGESYPDFFYLDYLAGPNGEGGPINKYTWFNTDDPSKLNLVLTMGNRQLVKDVDYTVSFSSRYNLPNNTMRIDFIGACNPLSQDVVIEYTSQCSKDVLDVMNPYDSNHYFWNTGAIPTYRVENGGKIRQDSEDQLLKDWKQWRWCEMGNLRKDAKGVVTIPAANEPQREDGTKDYRLKWGIAYSGGDLAGRDVVLDDLLPLGTTIDESSIKYYITNNETSDLLRNATQVENGVNVVYYTFSASEPEENKKQEISFGIKNVNPNGFYIYFETTVDTSKFNFDESFTKPYMNNALLYNAEHTRLIAVANSKQEIQHTAKKILEKTSEVDPDSNNSRVKYTVIINEPGKIIDEDDEWLTLTDVLDPRVTYAPGFTKLYDMSPEGNGRAMTLGSEYRVVYDTGSNKLTFTVPDGKYMKLEFTVAVRREYIGQNVSISNTIDMEGISSWSKEEKFVVGDVEFTVTRRGWTLDILKLGENDVPLAGVEFAVRPVEVIGTGANIHRGKVQWNIAVTTGTTGADGKVKLPPNSMLASDTLYYLEETKTLSDYKLKEGFYFMFRGFDTERFDEIAGTFVGTNETFREFSGQQQITLTNEKTNRKDITFGKKWDDAGYQYNRPDTVKITLLWSTGSNTPVPVPPEVLNGKPNPAVFTFGSANANETVFSVTYEDLPIKDANGNTYTYDVSEEMFKNGESYEGTEYIKSTDGYYVVNRHKDPSIRIQKLLEGVDDTDNVDFTPIEFKLYRAKNNGDPQGQPVLTFTIDEGLSPVTINKHTPDLDTNHWEFGGRYVLVETGALTATVNGKTVKFTKCDNIVFTIASSNLGNGTYIDILSGTGCASKDDSLSLMYVTNRRESEKISVSVNKNWLNGADEPMAPPAGVTASFTLYQKIGNQQPSTIIKDDDGNTMTITNPMVLPINGNWNGSWSELPKKIGNDDVTYTVSEAAIDGYTTTHTAPEVNDAGNITYTFTNKQNISFKVLKADKNGAALSGAELELFKLDTADNQYKRVTGSGIVNPWDTTANAVEFSGLSGSFKLVENRAPNDEYAKAAPVYFTVSSAGVVALASGNVTGEYAPVIKNDGVTVVMKDKQHSFIINKQMVSGDLPNDITLKLEHKVGDRLWEEVGTWTSGTSPEPWKITGRSGSFRLSETQSPAGVKKLVGYAYFDVDPDSGELTRVTSGENAITDPDVFSVDNTTATVTLKNDRFTAFVKKLFVDENKNGTILEADYPDGAEIQLWDTAITTAPVYTIIVDGDAAHGYDSTLKAYDISNYVIAGHSYRLVESKVPDGYIGSGEITFKVDDNGGLINISNNPSTTPQDTVEITNERNIEFRIKKTKLDGTVLEGVTLLLEKDNSTVAGTEDWQPVTEIGTDGKWTTDSTGIKTIQGLTGRFRLSEFSAHEDYWKLDGYVVFTVSAVSAAEGYTKVEIDSATDMDKEYYALSNNGVEIVLKNMPVEIELKKVFRDENDSIIQTNWPVGTTLRIFDTEGNQVGDDYVVTADTNSFTPKGLELGGQYVLKEDESTVPAGYSKAEDITFFVNDDGTVRYGAIGSTDELTMINKLVDFAILKTDKSGGLGGVTLKLTKKGTDGNYAPVTGFGLDTKGEWQTATAAKYFRGAGDYELSEVDAPAGYKRIAEAIKFTVTKEGAITGITPSTLANGSVSTDYDANNIVRLIVNDDDFGITVTKTFKAADGITDITAPFPTGAVLRLLRTDVTPEAPIGADITINVNQQIDITGRVVAGGEYKLVEVSAPYGYKLAAPVAFTVNNDGTVVYTGQTSDNNVDMVNRLVEFKIEKRDANGRIDGATLTLTQVSGGTMPETVIPLSGSSNPYTVKGYTGRFKLVETSAPNGYMKIDSEICFNVDAAGKITLDSGAVVNGAVSVTDSNVYPQTLIVTDKPFTVRISKGFKDVDGNDIPVAAYPNGAKIALFTVVNNVEQKVDNKDYEVKNGTYYFDVTNLAVGSTYILREVETPEGYTTANDIEFTVNKNGTVNIPGGSSTASEVKLFNRPSELEISKSFLGVDGTPAALPEGFYAELTLTDITNGGDGEVVGMERFTHGGGNWTLKSTQLIKNHIYKLEETRVPEGFILAEPVTFTYLGNGQYKIGDLPPKDRLDVVNQAFNVRVEKVDANGDPLAGAEFALYKGHITSTTGATLVEELKDDTRLKTFYILNPTLLKYGEEYTLVETRTPAGYKEGAYIPFTLNASRINANTTIKFTHVEKVPNASITAQFRKLDSSNGNNPLKGVGLTLSCDDDPNMPKTWNTATEQDKVISGLLVGKTYTLTESGRPAAYQQAKPISFTVQADGTLLGVMDADKAAISGNAVTMYNSKITETEFKVEKAWFDNNITNPTHIDITVQLTRRFADDTTADFEPVAGETVILGESVDAIGVWEYTFTDLPATDENGRAYEYSAYEVTVPDGYDEDYEAILDTDGLTIIGRKINNRNKFVNGKISKRMLTGDTDIPGAVLKITDLDGSNEVTILSGSDVETKRFELNKTYILSEVTAPDGYVLSDAKLYFKPVLDADGNMLFEAVDPLPATNEGGVDGDIAYLRDKPIEFKVTKTFVDEAGADLTASFAPGTALEIRNEANGGGTPIDTINVTPGVQSFTFTANGVGANGVAKYKVGETYYLREASTPDGYLPIDEISFTIADDGTVSYGGLTKQTNINMTNRRQVEFDITKLGADNTTPLSGVGLKLEQKIGDDWSEIATWTTGTDPNPYTVYNKHGEFRLTETSVPNGYKLDTTEYLFDVDENGKVTKQTDSDKLTTDDRNLTLKNDRFTARVQKVFTLPDGTTPVGTIPSGASMQILDLTIAEGVDGRVLDSWTVTDAASAERTLSTDVLDKMAFDKDYTLRELSAPDGYVKAQDITFRVYNDGSVKYKNSQGTYVEATGNVLTVTNKQTRFEVLKVDETESDLDGVTLLLEKGEGVGTGAENWQYVTYAGLTDGKWSTTTTGENPKTFIGLTGVFRLSEVDKPAEYMQAAPIVFEVADDGKLYNIDAQGNRGAAITDAKVTMRNSKIGKISITVNKTWEDYNSKNVVHPKITVKLQRRIGNAIFTDVPATGIEGGVNERELEAPGWSTTFAGLDRTNDAGTPYEYRIVEDVTTATGNKYTVKTSPATVVTTDTVTSYTIELTNTTTTVDGYISKRALTGTDETSLVDGELVGADLWLYEVDATNNYAFVKDILKWETGAEAKHFDYTTFEIGHYYKLEEEGAPDGYQKAEPIIFWVKEVTDADNNTTVVFERVGDGSGSVSGRTVAMWDKPNELEIRKTFYDVDGVLITPVPSFNDGATLALYDNIDMVNHIDRRTVYNASEFTYTIKSAKLIVGHTYTLRETNAPAGYAKTQDIVFTYNGGGSVTYGGKTQSGVDAENRKLVFKVGKVNLSGAYLPKAKLKLTQDGTSNAWEWTTGTNNNDNPRTFTDLKGSFTLEELTPPPGYTQSNVVTFTVDDFGAVTLTSTNGTKTTDGTIAVVAVQNTPFEAFIRKVFLDADGNPTAALKVPDNTVLQVIDPSITVGSKVIQTINISSQNEVVALDMTKITVGKDYQLVESTPGTGFKQADPITFHVNLDGTVSYTRLTGDPGDVDTVTMYNERDISFSVSKKDAQDNLIGDVGLRLDKLDADGNVVGSPVKWNTSDAGGNPKTFSNQYGRFLLTEETAPNGWAIADPIEFNVAVDGSVTDVSGNAISPEIVMTDKPLEVKISKVFKQADGTIDAVDVPTGAVLTVKEKDTGTLIHTHIVKAGETEFTLPVAKIKADTSYILEETSPAEGYEKIAPIEFKILSDGTVQYTGTIATLNGNTLTVPNRRYVEFEVLKASTGETPLAGAKLKLDRWDGANWTPVTQAGADGEWTTDANNNPKKLSDLYGSFKLSEVTPPDGYTRADPIEFTVGMDGTVKITNGNGVLNDTTNKLIPRIVMNDDKLNLYVQKRFVQADGRTAAVSVPAGTVLEIQKMDGTPLQPITVGAVDIDPQTGFCANTFEITAALAVGTEYKLVEDPTTTQPGYLTAAPITFKVENDGTISYSNLTQQDTVTMVNREQVEFKILKLDENSDPMPGVDFELQKKNATTGDYEYHDDWTSGTDAHTITNQTGDFRLIEKEVPDGYVKRADFDFTVKDDATIDYTATAGIAVTGNVIKTIEVTNSRFEVKIKKLFLDNNGNVLLDGNGDPITFEGGKGAFLRILDNGSQIYSWQATDSSEHTVATNLTAGKTYELEELTAPDGFIRSAIIEFTVNNDGTVTYDGKGANVPDDTVEVKNRQSRFEVLKTDSSNVALAGAKLKLEQLVGTRWTPVTQAGKDGEWITVASASEFTGLTGTFRLTEISTPSEFYQKADPIIFTVDQDGVVKIGDVVQRDARIVMVDNGIGTTSISVEKAWEDYGSSGTIVYPEITVKLQYRLLGSTAGYTDYPNATNPLTKQLNSGNGWKASFDNLPEKNTNGAYLEYSIEEIAVTGYTPVYNRVGNVIYITNKRNTVDGYFSKQDVGGSVEVKGAELTLYRVDTVNGVTTDTYITHWISDGTVKYISNDVLEIDKTYKLEETGRPSGYQLANEIVFTVDKITDPSDATKEIVVFTIISGGGNNGSARGRTLTMYDKPNEVVIEKAFLDEKGNTVTVPFDAKDGAVLVLRNAADDLVGGNTFVIDGRFTIDSALLIPGATYTLSETSAPDGYKLAAPITFTYNADGTVTYDGAPKSTAKLINKPMEFFVGKVNEQGDYIDGIKLRLEKNYGADDWRIVTADWETVSSGQNKNNPRAFYGTGVYRLTEVDAPDEWLIADDPIVFEVKADGTVTSTTQGVVDGVTIKMKNELVKLTKLYVEKVWEDYDSLNPDHPEITITLQRRQGSGSFANVPDPTTGADMTVKLNDTYGWKHTFEDLPATDQHGVAYEYTVIENVEGQIATNYTVEYTPDKDSQGYYSVIITNTTTTVDGKFSKKALNGNAELPGAKLHIEDMAGNIIEKRWTSDTQEHHVSYEKFAIDGTYKLVEDEPPMGYAEAGEIVFKVVEDTITDPADPTKTKKVIKFELQGTNGEVDGRTVTMRDKPILVKVVKQLFDADNKLVTVTYPAPGAQLQVLYNKVAVYEWTATSTNPETIIPQPPHDPITVGRTYTLHEESAPPGYKQAKDISFTVNGDGTVTYTDDEGNLVTGDTITMNDREHEFFIKKLDENGDPMDDSANAVTLRLQQYRVKWDDIATWSTSDYPDATRRFTGLKGAFRLYEDDAPDSYNLAPMIEFTVDDKGVVRVGGTPLPNNSVTVVMNNSKRNNTSVKVTKDWQDFDPLKPLQHGAITVQVQRKLEGEPDTAYAPLAPTVEGTLDNTNNWTMTFNNLPEETQDKTAKYVYTVVEKQTNSVTGYTTSIKRTSATSFEFTVTNTSTTIDGKFSKKALNNDVDELPGAFLRVEDMAGNEVVPEWESGTEPYYVGYGYFEIGKSYKLIEREPPAGYAKAGEITFTVVEETVPDPSDPNRTKTIIKFVVAQGSEGEAEGRTVTMRDKPIEVKVNKTFLDADGKQISAPIVGATMTVTRDATATEPAKQVDSWVINSTSDPNRTVKGLVVGGSYTLSEQVPEGYTAVDDIKFTVNDDGTVNYLTFANVSTIDVVNRQAGFKVLKVDDKNTPMGGVTLKLEKKDANGNYKALTGFGLDTEGKWSTSDADANPKSFSGLIGEFRLTETAAPDKWLLADPIEFRVDVNGKVWKGTNQVTDAVIKMTNKLVTITDRGVLKTWKEYDAKAPDPYPTIIVQLEHKLYGQSDFSPTGQTAVLPKSDGTWYHKFENLPDTDQNGKPIEYRITEIQAPDGYIVRYIPRGPRMIEAVNSTKVVDGEFSKVELGKNQEIKGARLKVVDADDNTVTIIPEWTSDGIEPYKIDAKKFEVDKSYTLVEVEPPAGYAKSDPITFTVKLDTVDDKIVFVINNTNQGNRRVVMKDAPIKITVRKHMGDGTTYVPGAKLRIVDLTDPQVPNIEWTTDNNDYPIERKLSINHNYRLEEYETPPGYITAKPILFTINEKGVAHKTGDPAATYPNNLILMDNPPFDVVVRKTDDLSNALAGAEMALFLGNIPDGTDVSALTPEEVWVSDDVIGFHRIAKKLQFGQTYTIVETKSPATYAVSKNIVFTLNDAAFAGVVRDPLTLVYTFERTVEDKPITATVQKIASATNLPLAKVTLKLICQEDPSYKKEWETDGTPYTVTGLIVGNTYILSEESAPTIYNIAAPIRFKVQPDGSLYDLDRLQTIPNNSIVMRNDLIEKTSFEVIKVWNENNLVVTNHAPITMQLTRKYVGEGDDKLVDVPGEIIELNDTYGWKHTFTNLDKNDQQGRVYVYWAYEVNPPTGYVVDYKPIGNGVGVIATNTSDYVGMKISKRSLTGNDELPGASFELTDELGNVLLRFVSGAKPYEIDTKIFKKGGIYTLTETLPPDGYAKSPQSLTFRVDIDTNGKPIIDIRTGINVGGVDGDTLFMCDEPLDIKVLKVDNANSPLPNARLALYEGDPLTGKHIVTWKSNDNAISLRQIAPPGYLFKRNQTYTLRELDAPVGYMVANDISFTIDTADTVAVKSVSYVNTPFKVIVNKIDTTGTRVGGAVVALYNYPIRTGDQPIEVWNTSDASSHDIQSKLVYGSRYTLREVSAPGGYLLAPDVTFTLDRAFLQANGTMNTANGTFEITIPMVDPKTGVSILKRDQQSGKPLAGAKLELYKGTTINAANLVEAWTTTTAPKVFTGRLEVGETYLLVETAAPNGYMKVANRTFKVTAAHSETNPLEITVDDPHLYRFRKVSSATGQPVSGATLAIVDSKNREVYRWTTIGEDYHELDGTLTAGETYSLREVGTPSGYTTAAPVVFSVTADGWLVMGSNPMATDIVEVVVMVNTPTIITTAPPPPPATVDIPITKRWDDSDNALALRPAQITINLFRKLRTEASYPAAPYLTAQVSGGTNAATWTFTFYGLDRYDANRVYYDYLITEEPIPGYNTSYVNNGRTIINSMPEDVTPTPTLPVVTPTPAPTQTVPAGLRNVDGEWVYITEDGIPLGVMPQTGDDTSWLLWGLAIVLPLLIAGLMAVEIRRRKKRAALEAHRNDG